MSPEPPRKFFDIARPGSHAPSATSRPVIASRNPVRDPFLHEQLPSPLAAAAAPHKTAAQPRQPETPPVPEATPAAVDAEALLIQAGLMGPAKASRSRAQHIALGIMVIMIVVLAAITYIFVSSM